MKSNIVNMQDYQKGINYERERIKSILSKSFSRSSMNTCNLCSSCQKLLFEKIDNFKEEK